MVSRQIFHHAFTVIKRRRPWRPPRRPPPLLATTTPAPNSSNLHAHPPESPLTSARHLRLLPFCWNRHQLIAIIMNDLINGVVRAMRGVRVPDHVHASRGGRAYPKEVRELVLQMIQDGGIEAVKTPAIRSLQEQKKFPCLATCRRWLNQFLAIGHVRPMRATGNRVAQREIWGEALFHLAFYRAIRPHTLLCEVKAYLTNRLPNVAPYSDSQIYRAEKRLGLSRKAASRTSQFAYTPANLEKRKMYWERSYPLGINNEQTADVIDIDEARFKLESADRSYGKVAREFRCNLKGKYKKGEPGVNLIMAILGDANNPYSFHQTFTEGGTDLFRFYGFMRDLIDHLAATFPGRSFMFTMDNLNIHKHQVILDLIRDRGHRIVFRAPYWSCDGAIEYVFNTIHTHLEMDNGTHMVDVQSLVNRINLIIGSIPSFRRYFLHVGFPDN
jgi:hypothetical protein